MLTTVNWQHQARRFNEAKKRRNAWIDYAARLGTNLVLLHAFYFDSNARTQADPANINEARNLTRQIADPPVFE